MLEQALDILSWICVLGGLFFILVGTAGVLRMPDVFTRIHAAGMTDTMGAGFLILGMCFQTGLSLLTLRFLLVYAFLLFTSPIASHSLARSALLGKVPTYKAPMGGV